MTAASAAYLNIGLEPTPYSLRSFLASAFGRGSGPAFGDSKEHKSYHQDANKLKNGLQYVAITRTIRQRTPMMSETNTLQNTVVRTLGGLFIAGTRITLYDVLDYLTADWPPHLIRQWLNLTKHQMADVMQYIDTHRAELDTEYQQVLQQAQDIRQYWDARNRERGAHPVARPPTPSQEEARAKLRAWKAKREQTC